MNGNIDFSIQETLFDVPDKDSWGPDLLEGPVRHSITECRDGHHLASMTQLLQPANDPSSLTGRQER